MNITDTLNRFLVSGTNKFTTRAVRARYLIAADLVGTILVFLTGYVIRFESLRLIIDHTVHGIPLLLFALPLRIAIYLFYGMYSRLWRRASIKELILIASSVSLGTIVLLVVNFLVFPLLGIPHVISRGVILIDWILNILYLGGSRISIRVVLDFLEENNRRLLSQLSRKRRVLIYGAGDVGTTILRLINNNRELGLLPLGFIDDDPHKKDQIINDLKVFGSRDMLPKIIRDYNVEEIIIAISNASQKELDAIYKLCLSLPVITRVVPSMHDLLFGTLSVDQLRQWRTPENGFGPKGHIKKSLPPSPPQMNCLMVTGGAGFIGSNFVHHMLEKYPGYQIIVYDKLTYAGNPDNLLGLKNRYGDRYEFVKADICDFQAVADTIQKYRIDTIVNFAAETHVDRSLMTPENFLQTNVFGTYNLLEAARQLGVARYHQVSTDEVYGQVLRGSFFEGDPLETRSPYSASKAAADLLVNSYHNSYNIFATITRGSNNIGPYQYPEKVVPLFITSALEDRPLPIYGDGQYVRDYQYVMDHCRGIDAVLHKGEAGQVYNLGGGNELAAIDLARRILDYLGKPYSLLRYVKDRPGQDRRYSLNCAKMREIGWEPLWTFDKALSDTIDWYLQNDWWWRKLKNQEYNDFYEKQYRERLDTSIAATLQTIKAD